jgi:hypothetical protein
VTKNELNIKYHETKLKLEKMPNSISNIEKLNRIYRKHVETLKAESMDDLDKLNDGKVIRIK